MYLSLSYAVVLKRKQKKSYVPPDINLTIDALVDTKFYASASAQDELLTIKQKAPNKTFKIDDPPNF